MSNKYDGSDPMIEAEVTIDPARPVKPAKPPEGGSPLGRLDAEALESQRAHERDLADRGARPVEDREPGMPVYPPFGQSGVPLVDDNGAPFPEETQQLFRAVAQNAYLRGTRDQREREQAGKRRKCTSGHYLTDEGAHGQGQTWCGAGPEPVGPYAPTRTPNLDDRAAAAPERFEAGYRQGWRERHVYGTPRYKGLPMLTNRPEGGTELGDYLVEQFGSVGTRIDGLVDVVIGIGRQMTDNRVWASERFDRIDTALTKLTDLFVDSRDEIERTMTRPEYLRWKEGFDFGIKGFAEEMATARRETREAFERGRQQGDADRAQRGLAEFVRGRSVGMAEREAELLEAGWTPPGAPIEGVRHELNAYEVWRDALSIAGAQRNRRELEQDRVLADAVWFWDRLISGPPGLKGEYLRPMDEATRQIVEPLGDIGDGTTFGTNPDDDHIDGDETSWGPGDKIGTDDIQTEPRMGTGND